MNVLNMLLYSFEDIVVPPKVITDLPTYHNTDNINVTIAIICNTDYHISNYCTSLVTSC